MQGPCLAAPGSSSSSPESEGWEPSATLEGLRAAMAAFAAERDWQQFHTPRNLLLALVSSGRLPVQLRSLAGETATLRSGPRPCSQTGEVGELAELFQWRGEVAPRLPTFTAAERVAVGEELSDVLLYLIRLSDSCGIDLGAAACVACAALPCQLLPCPALPRLAGSSRRPISGQRGPRCLPPPLSATAVRPKWRRTEPSTPQTCAGVLPKSTLSWAAGARLVAATAAARAAEEALLRGTFYV